MPPKTSSRTSPRGRDALDELAREERVAVERVRAEQRALGQLPDGGAGGEGHGDGAKTRAPRRRRSSAPSAASARGTIAASRFISSIGVKATAVVPSWSGRRRLSTTRPSAARVRRSAESGGLKHVTQQSRACRGVEPLAVALVDVRPGLQREPFQENRQLLRLPVAALPPRQRLLNRLRLSARQGVARLLLQEPRRFTIASVFTTIRPSTCVRPLIKIIYSTPRIRGILKSAHSATRRPPFRTSGR